jgi:hypothetical protein
MLQLAQQLSQVLTLLEPFHEVIFMETVRLCRCVLLRRISSLETVGFAEQKAYSGPSGKNTTNSLTREARFVGVSCDSHSK